MILKRFRKQRLALIGAILLMLLSIGAFFADQLTMHDPDSVDIRNRFAEPSSENLLGTDELGRDIFSRVLHAGRTSLSIGLGVAIFSVLLGGILGGIAGYAGRWVDGAISMLIDTMLSIPALALAMVAGAFIPLSSTSLIVILSLISWPTIARLVRGQVIAIKELTYIEAAHATGLPVWKIIFRHIVPNTLAPVFVAGSLLFAFAILIESALSFLGYGVPPPAASWGRMLNQSQLYFRDAPWLAFYPGLAITLTVASVNFVGEGLRKAFDPKAMDHS